MIAAQITDTHIKVPGKLAYGRVDTADFLAKAVAHINGLTPSPDVVLLTGDLTDGGKPAEFDHLRELLAPLRMPLLAIPGNHDAQDSFRVAFGDSMPLPDSGDISYVADDYPVRLVMIDSTVAGAPHGEFTPARLDWLQEALAAAADRPTLLAMHHPPFVTGIDHMDAMNCRGAEGLAAVIGRHEQVLGMICGHVHRSIQTSFAGRQASIAPSTAHAVSLALSPDAPSSYHFEPPALHLHVWHDDSGRFGRLTTHQSFIGDYEGPHSFATPEAGAPLEPPTA